MSCLLAGIPAPEGESTACWRDKALFSSFSAFYAHEREGGGYDLCMITGAPPMSFQTCTPKRGAGVSNGAKLISSKMTVTALPNAAALPSPKRGQRRLDASQKAHSACAG